MSRQTYTHTSGNGSSAIRYREAGTAKPRVSSDPGLVVPMCAGGAEPPRCGAGVGTSATPVGTAATSAESLP